MSKKNSDYVSDWSKVIDNTKFKTLRIFKKEDIERKTPFIFDGWKRDYKTGDKLISIHTKKHYDNEIDAYLGFVLDEDTFRKEFEEVVIEYWIN